MDLEQAFKVLLVASKSYTKLNKNLTKDQLALIKTAIKTLEDRYKELKKDEWDRNIYEYPIARCF